MNKKYLILCGFILAKFVIQYTLISPEYELHRDEFLHLDQAHHLDWGYQSVPPVTSWISYLILLLGNGVFWIKFFPALFGALNIVAVWKIIMELNGRSFALCLGAISVLFSSLLRINILYQPNSLDILLWTCLYLFILKYINSQKIVWLYVASFTFALGFLNKYNIVFLLLGLFPALLLTEHRKLFGNKHFYFAGLTAIVLIMPNLIWQYTNHFPVIHHMQELKKTQLENINRFDFFKEQMLFFIGALFTILIALPAFFIFKPFHKFKLFLWAFLFSLLLFVYFQAKGYYAIGLYPIILAFGAVYMEHISQNGFTKYLRPLLLLLPVLLFIPIYKIAFPNISPIEIQKHLPRYKKLGLLRWEDGKDHNMPQDFADMLGWKELASKTDSASRLLDDKAHTLILCDNYGEAGAINFYSKEHLHAVSLNADYINWFSLDKQIINVILVKESKDDGSELRRKNSFETVKVFGVIKNEFAREKGTKIYILANTKINVNEIIRKEIYEQRLAD